MTFPRGNETTTLSDGTVIRCESPIEAYVRGGLDPEIPDENALDYEVQWYCQHGWFKHAAALIRGWVEHREEST